MRGWSKFYKLPSHKRVKGLRVNRLNSRERIDTILHFEEPDRVGLWIELFNETWIKYQANIKLPKNSYNLARAKCGSDMTTIPMQSIFSGYDQITIEETEEWTIIRDEWGVKKKTGEHTRFGGEVLEAPVKCLDDFKEKIEAFMDPDDPRRVTSSHYPYKKDLKEAVRNRRRGPYGDLWVSLWVTGPFELCSGFVGGMPQLLTIMVKDPHFTSYMFNSVAEYEARICEVYIDAGVDGIFLGEDLGYKNGPFFSPDLYRKLLAPAHKKIFHPFSKRGMPCLIHSDGNVKMLIPDFIKIGITALNPLEVKAGMDVKELKIKYGDKLAFIGGIDVRTLASSKEKIKKEITEKISIAAQGGGFVVGPDHCIPPEVSFENFQFFRKLAIKYGKYPPQIS